MSKNNHYRKNPIFIQAAVLMIFKKNYGIKIDTHEIDSKLTIGENISILQDRYVFRKFNKEDY